MGRAALLPLMSAYAQPLTGALIDKCVVDLQRLGLLEGAIASLR